MTLIIWFTLKKIFTSNNLSETNKPLPNISIVIAAKNEARNLQRLIDALACQSADTGSFEVIIINDHSQDDTERLLINYALQYPWLRTGNLNNSYFSGKRNALLKGISMAKHENIGITDADCVPAVHWIETLQKSLVSGAGMVFGLAVSEITENYISRIGSYENFKGSLLILFAAYMGKPFSARAANLAFSKALFLKLGGYTSIAESISGDDDLLIREAFKAKQKINYFTNPDSRVLYFQKDNLRDYLRQKARHTSSSHHYLLSHKLALTFWHGINIFAQWSFLFWYFSPYFLYLTILKMAIEYMTLIFFQKNFGYKFRFFDKLLLPFIYEFFVEVNFIYSFFRKSKW